MTPVKAEKVTEREPVVAVPRDCPIREIRYEGEAGVVRRTCRDR